MSNEYEITAHQKIKVPPKWNGSMYTNVEMINARIIAAIMPQSIPPVTPSSRTSSALAALNLNQHERD
jgi:hypothetical protein